MARFSQIMSENMKDSISIIFLLLLILSPSTFAETSDGTIPFDCPDIPNAKFQFHFTRELIALATTEAPFNTVEDLYIQIHDYHADVFDKLAQYYSESLKAKNWYQLQKDSNSRLYILEGATEKSSRTDNTVIGIFAVVKNDEDVYLLNVIGNIYLQQIEKLLANLDELGIEIRELKSLGDLTLPKVEETAEPMPLPTLFRVAGNLSTDVEKSKVAFSIPSSSSYTESHIGHWTYRGHPIERIQIRAKRKKQVAEVSDGLKNRSKDITELLDGLLLKNGSADTPKFIVNAAERSVTIRAGEPSDDTQPTMLTKSFRTREGDPIHEIVIRGNRYTEANTVREALESGSEEIAEAVKTLAFTVSTYEKVELVIEEKDSQRTAIITAVEKPPAARFYTDGTPQIGFNRVTGWELGAQFESGFRRQEKSSISFGMGASSESSGDDNSKLFAQIGYGFGNKQSYYRAGGSIVRSEPDSWHLGFTTQFHRATGTIAPELFSHYNESGADFLRVFGMQDYPNYYLREGVEVALQWKPIIPTLSFKLALLAEAHDSLEKSTDWHFFNWRSRSKARENPAITPGHMRSITFQYNLSTRQNHLGWHNTFSVEYSNAAFGSDFDFTRYQLHLRYAHPFGKHQIRTRAIGSFSTASLPIQRQFVIGGPGLLNGYPLYAFAGDHGYLFNIEYFLNLPQLFTWRNMRFNFDFDLFLVFFLDAGQTWNIADDTHTLVPKSDAGLGFQFGESDSFLRFNVAKAFESEQDAQFNFVWFYTF